MTAARPPSGWRAWLVLMRLSNLPTVWTNVLVGATAGYVVALITDEQILHAPAAALGATFIAMSLIYIAGMILNDVFDLAWDREHRPERPLAAQRISRRIAITAAIAMLVLAMLLMTLTIPGTRTYGPVFTAALIVTVATYDWLHKRWSGAAVLMGACRAWVYLVAAAVITPPSTIVWWRIVGPIALLMGIYVTLVTLVAQREAGNGPGARRWLAVPLFVLPVFALVLVPVPAGAYAWWWLALTGAGMGVWLGYAAGQALARPARLHKAVPAWLAGIALVDTWLLVLLGAPVAAVAAGACFALSVAAQRWIPAT